MRILLKGLTRSPINNRFSMKPIIRFSIALFLLTFLILGGTLGYGCGAVGREVALEFKRSGTRVSVNIPGQW
jgi:hypothetical protein